jgi:hypothetical protein
LASLKEARGDLVFFAEKNEAWLPMLSLYDQLISSGGEVLFGSVIMGGGLVFAARNDVARNEGVIVIEFDPRKSQVSLSYQNEEVEPTQSEVCSMTEIWERLRLFAAYKFGVRLKKEPNQPVQPTPGSSAPLRG